MNEENDFIFRSMTEEEDMYVFSNSSQICAQTGFIGHLRADLDTNGTGFFSTWFDWNKELKTQAFKDEFDDVINDLRVGILTNRTELTKWCNATPQARLNTEEEYYGIRIDTDEYAYLIRLCPLKGNYNVYAYCYKRHWLDLHIKDARKGIRFIDSAYQTKYVIKDGDKVKLIASDGEEHVYVCRYIDPYHLEVGDNIYHICELAEWAERNNTKIIPLRSNLPKHCYAATKDGRIIIVKKGEKGFYDTQIPIPEGEDPAEFVADYNSKLGVTKAQAAAMVAGSMFGFDTDFADPARYDVNGNLIPKKEGGRL